MTTPETASTAASPVEEKPPLYETLEGWVAGYFTPMFLHRAPGNPRIRWCPRWWDHAEAIARLTLLWNTWEGARWEPAAKPGWWIDLDHHLTILVSLDGPFRNCRITEGARPGKHQPDVAPDIEPSPPGWWD